jgi:hypothetical protein
MGRPHLHVFFQVLSTESLVPSLFFRRRSCVRSSELLSGQEPGNIQRQSLKLPYADWLPHERVSSQACLGLSAGVGVYTEPGEFDEDHHDRLPGSTPDRAEGSPFYLAMLALISWPMAHTKPASSRASAVTTTVAFLPFAIKVR